MTNRQEAWRLKDDEGNYMGVAPHFESLYLAEPYLDSFFGSFSDEAMSIRRRTISMEIQDIVERMVLELERYRERYYENPSFFSLSQRAYESFYACSMTGLVRLEADAFVGISIICHPEQSAEVLCLGKPIDEMLGRGLYNAE